MSEPVVAQKAPIPVDVEEGKTYFWCSCGQSSKQPFCDGSHSGTDFTPMAWESRFVGQEVLLRLQEVGQAAVLRWNPFENLTGFSASHLKACRIYKSQSGMFIYIIKTIY